MQFNQPDTVIPDTYNALDWNRYSYVRYNPINFNDPSGHDPRPGQKGDYKPEPQAGHPLFRSIQVPRRIKNTVNAEQDAMANDPVELLSRAILGEEGGKLFTDLEDDAYGIAWAIRNRHKSGYYKNFSKEGITPRLKPTDPEYGEYEWYWSAASSIYGLHTNAALDPIGSGHWGDVDETLKYYNRAREIAEFVLAASDADDITGYPGYYMEWYDAQNRDDSNPYERTHFRVKDNNNKIIALGICVTSATVCR